MTAVKKSVLGLIVYRLLIVSALLVAAVVIQLSTAVFLPLGPFYAVIAAFYAGSLLFLLLYSRNTHYRGQAVVQFFFDVLLITALVYISGGLGGRLYVLYILPILGAGLILSLRGAYLIASTAAVAFGFLADGMYYGLIPYFQADQARETSTGLVLYTIFLAWALFFLIAILSGQVGKNLRRTREELARAQRDLAVKERLAQAGRLSAQIAHEIRNPLAAISAAVQVLRADVRPEGESGQLIDIVVRESGRVSRTIDDFLNLASPGPAEFAAFHPAEIIREIVIMLRMSGDLAENVTVEGGFEDDSLIFFGSQAQFKQLLWNLLRNAGAAMPGGGSLRIGLARADGDGLFLSVSDTGRGIPAEERERLFEPFYSTSPGGRGLGLSVVRQIVDDYEGRIEVRSEPGRGAEFRVTLAGRPRPAPRKEP